MVRPSILRALVTVSLATMLAITPAAAQLPQIADNTDPGFAAQGQVEIVAAIPDLDPSGIAVIGGRIFLSFPKHDGDHAGPTLGEWKDGRVEPFPDARMASATTGAPANRLISVHGLTTDTRGRLWAIDDGKVKCHPIAPGGAKLVGFDPDTGRVVATVVLRDGLLSDSHMNDLRVDLTHGAQGTGHRAQGTGHRAQGTAYISDSSFDGHPALVVVDIATGRQRRVLAADPRIQADPGYQTVLDGRVLHQQKPATFPGSGVDGVTLSPDSATLYFAALASRRLYSIPTALISDFAKDDARLAAAIRDEGEKGAADGLATDPWGRIYTTAADHDAVFRRDTDGNFALVARDPRFVWPDGIFADAQHVYVVLGQWTRLPVFHNGQDMRRPPYLVARMPIVVP